MSGPDVEALLQAEIAFARRAPINGFPSLLLQTSAGFHLIELDYLDATPMHLQIEAALGYVNLNSLGSWVCWRTEQCGCEDQNRPVKQVLGQSDYAMSPFVYGLSHSHHQGVHT